MPEATTSKAERMGSGLGMYRAGGPTTIFGGSGWGPYSDGPLNAVRKSLLTRDGLNEENWMYVAAQRTAEASREWADLRAEAMRVCGGLSADGAAGGGRGSVKRRKVWDADEPLPLGVYEPHTGAVLCECSSDVKWLVRLLMFVSIDRSDTQPTRARWEPVGDGKPVLGGTKAGSQAWGLAWVDTVMEFPRPEEIDEENTRLRAPFLQYVDSPS